jgi:hypothetical protein
MARHAAPSAPLIAPFRVAPGGILIYRHLAPAGSLTPPLLDIMCVHPCSVERENRDAGWWSRCGWIHGRLLALGTGCATPVVKTTTGRWTVQGRVPRMAVSFRGAPVNLAGHCQGIRAVKTLKSGHFRVARMVHFQGDRQVSRRSSGCKAIVRFQGDRQVARRSSGFKAIVRLQGDRQVARRSSGCKAIVRL